MKRWLGLGVIMVGLATAANDGGHEGKPGKALNTIRLTVPGAGPGARPLELVRIPPGTFFMGCPADERGRVGREWSSHQVTLTKSIYLGRHEVTQGQ